MSPRPRSRDDGRLQTCRPLWRGGGSLDPSTEALATNFPPPATFWAETRAAFTEECTVTEATDLIFGAVECTATLAALPLASAPALSRRTVELKAEVTALLVGDLNSLLEIIRPRQHNSAGRNYGRGRIGRSRHGPKSPPLIQGRAPDAD